ncbi:MAG: aromatic-ring-hydroxylating dioxygenase subunit beta [Alicyclobacillus sp.]|nr:aromatic-ring-hydroxylating dioxygenase subunit beta [Alicyclobacillus sp.]
MSTVSATNVTYGDVVRLLFQEAACLDRRDLDGWLAMLADDVVYRMPLRITKDPRTGSDIVEGMTFFEETKVSLRTRVERLKTTSAWAEMPPTRTRHFISNILVDDGPEPDTLAVTSSFLVLRSRRDSEAVEQVFGERQDVWRKSDEGWKLVRRTIYPDQTTLTVLNLSMFI